MYPLPAYVNPQGNDLGKALLLYAEGKPLGTNGGYWLAIHGANIFGNDKVSFQECVEWVYKNTNLIVETAKDPMATLEWWGNQADKPYGFLAFCFEWAEYVASDYTENYVSYIPIAMDGTCNGLQHFSAMLKDTKCKFNS